MAGHPPPDRSLTAAPDRRPALAHGTLAVTTAFAQWPAGVPLLLPEMAAPDAMANGTAPREFTPQVNIRYWPETWRRLTWIGSFACRGQPAGNCRKTCPQ